MSLPDPNHRQLPGKWREFWDPTAGRPYFVNYAVQPPQSSWDDPRFNDANYGAAAASQAPSAQYPQSAAPTLQVDRPAGSRHNSISAIQQPLAYPDAIGLRRTASSVNTQIPTYAPPVVSGMPSLAPQAGYTYRESSGLINMPSQPVVTPYGVTQPSNQYLQPQQQWAQNPGQSPAVSPQMPLRPLSAQSQQNAQAPAKESHGLLHDKTIWAVAGGAIAATAIEYVAHKYMNDHKSSGHHSHSHSSHSSHHSHH